MARAHITAVPAWRMATFRFATHIELHRARMTTKSGDRSGGLARARRAWSTLPADRRSQTLELVLREVERSSTQASLTRCGMRAQSVSWCRGNDHAENKPDTQA